MKKYEDCQHENGGNCAACSLSSYGRDCHNNPIPDASELISTSEYAALHQKADSSVRTNIAPYHRFKTATKIGRNWFISRNELWPNDERKKSGKYVGWRKPKSES